MTLDQFENHSAAIESQLTKPHGYAIRGPWDHSETTNAMRHGDLAVTEYRGVGGRRAFVALVNASVKGVQS